MDVSRLRTGEKIAGAAGIALLLIMFIFDWFSIEGESLLGVSIGGNAWDTMELIRFVILLAALAGIALAVMSASQTRVDMPVAMSAITAGLGILATLLILYRIIDPPGGDIPDGAGVEIGRDIGVFLGLIAAALVAYGGWRAMQEEGTSFSAQADRVGDNDRTADREPPPPPPPPPAAPPAGGTGTGAPPGGPTV